jgi:hypothetical protein
MRIKGNKFLIILLLTISLYAKAQDNKGIKYKHSIQISAASLSNSLMHDNNFIIPDGYLKQVKYTPTYSISYAYGIKKWLSVEGRFSFLNNKIIHNNIYTDKIYNVRNYNYYWLNGIAKFKWYNKDFVSFYSSAGLSLNFKTVSDKRDNSRYKFKNTIKPNIVFLPIGITVGSKIYGMTEIGYVNDNVLIVLGFGYRF